MICLKNPYFKTVTHKYHYILTIYKKIWSKLILDDSKNSKSQELTDSEADNESEEAGDETEDDTDSGDESGIGQTHSGSSDEETKAPTNTNKIQENKPKTRSKTKQKTKEKSSVDILADKIKETSVNTLPVEQKGKKNDKI